MSANGVPFKAQALMRDLKMRLQITLSGTVTYTDALDLNGFPNLLVQRGSESIWLHIEDVGNAGRVDGLGLPQRAYSPHKTQLLRDSTVSDNDLRNHLMAEATKSGTELEVWEIHPISTASFTLSGATEVSVVKSDAINPLTSQN